MVHLYHEEDTGESSPYSGEQRALMAAFARYHEIFGTQYISVKITPRECPGRGYDIVKGKSHYCDLFEVEIEIPELNS